MSESSGTGEWFRREDHADPRVEAAKQLEARFASIEARCADLEKRLVSCGPCAGSGIRGRFHLWDQQGAILRCSACSAVWEDK